MGGDWGWGVGGNHQGSLTLVVNIQPGRRLEECVEEANEVQRCTPNPGLSQLPTPSPCAEPTEAPRLLPGGTEHGVVAGERGGAVEREEAWRNSLVHSRPGHPGRSLSSPATSAVATSWAWQGPVPRAAWRWLDLRECESLLLITAPHPRKHLEGSHLERLQVEV